MKSLYHSNRLGVDIGGVLKPIRVDSSPDQFDPAAHPPFPDAIEVLGELSRSLFTDLIWIISKAGPKWRRQTRQWLNYYGFFEKTEIHPNQIIFVNDDKEKAVWAKKLRLTHFIDDKPGILQQLADHGIKRLYLYKPDTKGENMYRIPAQFTIVRNWTDIRKELL